jgi:hypothetical protein
MKKLVALLLLAGSMSLTAQDKSKVFSSTEAVWFGLDFTKATFVGQFDQGAGAAPANGLDIKNKYIPAWNNLIAGEQKKYDLKKAFRKDNIIYDMNSVNELNTKIDVDNCMSFNAGKIEKSQVDEMVKKYNSSQKEGLGLVFIVENFNKGIETASVYVTFFDIATKKILLCERMEGKAMGVGIRNHWAGSIKHILDQLDDGGVYKSWKGK